MNIRHLLTAGALLLAYGCDPGPTATSETVPPTRPVAEEPPPTDTPADDNPVTSADVKQEIQEAFDSASEYTAEKKDRLAVVLREQKAVLDRKVHELDEKVTAMTEEARADWAKEKVVIDQKREALDARLELLQKNSGEAWTELQGGVRDAWNQFEQSVEKAASKYTARQ